MVLIMDCNQIESQIKKIKIKIDTSPNEAEILLNGLLSQNISKEYKYRAEILQCSLRARDGKVNQAIDELDAILNSLSTLNFPEVEIKALAVMADFKQTLGYNLEALKIIDKAEKLISITPQFDAYLELMNTKIVALHRLGKYHDAIELGNDLISQVESYPEKKYMAARFYNNVALNYELLGDLKQAEQCYNQCYTISKENSYNRGTSISLNNLGDIWYLFGEFEKAKQAYEEGILIANQISDKMTIGLLNKSYAKFSLEIGNVDNAQELIEKALEMFLETQYTDQIIKSYYIYAKIWIFKGNYQKALGMIEKSNALANQYQIDNSVIDLCILSAEIWNTLGYSEETYFYLKKADKMALECESRVSFAQILIVKAKMDLTRGLYHEVELGLQRALHHGIKSNHIEIQFNAKILLAQNLLSQFQKTQKEDYFSEALEIIDELSLFTKQKGLIPKFISVQIIFGLLKLLKNEKKEAKEIYLELRSITIQKRLDNLRELVEGFLKLTDGAELTSKTAVSPNQQMLLTIVQDHLSLNSPGMSYNRIENGDVKEISLVAYKVDEKMGPVVLNSVNIAGDDPTMHAELVLCGSIYATTLGQGGSYHTGLFGVLPFGNRDLRAFIYTTIAHDSSQLSSRSNNESYILLTLIFPEKFLQLFNNRVKLKAIFATHVNQIQNAVNMSQTWLKAIRDDIIKSFCSNLDILSSSPYVHELENG
ncbi:hypothetical protein WKT22_00524 [Candidatus Lokiarchaeum ossiferum]